MQLAKDTHSGNYTIQSYAEGEIRINDRIYRESLVITAERLITDWPPETPQQLQAEHLESILALNPGILILGTGSRLEFPEPALLHRVQSAGIGLEVMDTAAACRTYTVLVSEDRNVVAALMMI